MTVLLLLPVFLLLFILAAYTIVAPSVAVWRTIKALKRAASDEPEGENAVAVRPFLSRPPARGRQKPPSGFRFSGKPWLLPDERAKLYRSERKVVQAAGRARVILAITTPAVITICYAGPVYVALVCGAPWYHGYMRLVTGYQPLTLYNPADLMLARMTAQYFVQGGLMLLFVLGLVSIRGILTNVRRGRNTRPMLIAEMRRLDVLLWRKSRRKLQEPAAS